MEGKRFVILRGIGKYYGHSVKAELLEFDKIQCIAEVKTSEGEMTFNTVTGFEAGIGKETGFSTYQLDIDTLEDNQFSYRQYINRLREV